MLVDVSWQEGQDVGWQEGHRVTRDLSEGLCCEGSDDTRHAPPNPAPTL